MHSSTPLSPRVRPLCRATAALLTLLALPRVHAAPGDVDPGFTANANDDTYSAVLQPGGKLLVGGNFSVIKGQSRRFLTRLLPDGTVDTQFNATATAIVWGITTQPDGKALIAGVSHPSFPGPIMYRVLANGTMDPGFTTPVPDSDVRNLSLRSDGVITAAGPFRNLSGVSRSYAARLTSTGSLDATVLPLPNSRLFCQAMLPDGKLLIGGGFSVVGSSQRYRIARLNANGSVDSGFNTGFFEDTPMIYCIAVQADGKILVGGTYASSTVTNRYYISRHQANGALDTTFTTVVNDDVTSIALQCDGKIICSGDFTTVNGVARNRIARLHADGTLDTTFNPDANATVEGTSLQADGKVIVNGRFSRVGRGNRDRIARLLNDPATESLTVPSPARVQWLRGGSSPETHFVTFELSTNGGSSWTALGAGTRITGGWELSGQNLSGSGQIRARAVTTCGINNGSQGILETITPFVQAPEIAVHNGTTTTAPELQNSTSPPLDFGTARQGTPVTRPLTVANTGLAALRIAGVSAPAGFSLLTPPAFPAVVAAGQSLTLQLRLDAAAPGNVSGTLILISDDADESAFRINLMGRVITPEITVREGAAPPLTELTDGQAAAVDYGIVRQTSPQSKVLTVSNAGTATLLISSVSVPPGYSLPDLPPLPVTVTAGQSLAFRLQLDTAAPGTFSGSIRVESDDLDEPVFDFPVTGTVVTPEITVYDGAILTAPEVSDGQINPVHFGTARQGTPVIRSVLIANTGTARLFLEGMSLPQGYSLLNSPALPAAVEIDGTLTLNIRLDAATPGTFSGSVVIASDDLDEPVFDFPLTGTVVSPEIEVHNGPLTAPELTDGQTAAVDFGTARQATPVVLAIAVANTGTAPLLIASVTTPAGYTVLQLPPLPATIGVNESLPLQIRLDATDLGTFAGTITIASDDLDEAAFDFPVTGTVVSPEIAVHYGTPSGPELTDGQAAPLDFGRNIQGTAMTRNLTIANTGTADLMVSSVAIPPGFTALDVPPLPLAVGVGQSVTFQISLSTFTVGTHTGSVVIASDDLDEAAFDFPITGEVFIPDPVAAALSTTTVLRRQTGLREQTIHLTNDTTATVPAYNLIIRGLPEGVEVNNASSRREDGSWVVYVRRTMNPRSTQDILLEYYSANRGPVEIAPQLSTEVVLNPPDLAAAGGGFIIDRVLRLEGGAMLLEFPTTPGRQYQVQYSHDGTNWQASLPAIRAAANRTQWADRGLPRTDSHPSTHGNRFYRVAELAQ